MKKHIEKLAKLKVKMISESKEAEPKRNEMDEDLKKEILDMHRKKMKGC